MVFVAFSPIIEILPDVTNTPKSAARVYVPDPTFIVSSASPASQLPTGVSVAAEASASTKLQALEGVTLYVVASALGASANCATKANIKIPIE